MMRLKNPKYIREKRLKNELINYIIMSNLIDKINVILKNLRIVQLMKNKKY